jgi:AraC-like DNA-binding protein
MVDATLIPTADLLLRGGVCLLLLMLAGLMARDHGRVVAGRLGAAFCLGVAAYAVCSAAGLHARLGLWSAPILALASGNNLVFWLFARSLFDDGFRPRPWHAGLWLAVVALGLALGLVLPPQKTGLTLVACVAETLSTLAFAGLAVIQTIASWRADLVERRRRLRLFIVAACAGYIALNTTANALGAAVAAPQLASLVEAAALAAIAGAVAWSLLNVGGGQALFPDASAPRPALASVEAAEAPLSREDLDLVAALERAMAHDRLYRQENLTIGALAARQGLPEYRLRRLINQGLGHRNFNAFLNGYRIAEAKAALADPSQAEVPILTIALDAGFASLGPFNRAFKAETGVTPSAWRRDAGGDGPRSDTDGSLIPASASRISNSA